MTLLGRFFSIWDTHPQWLATIVGYRTPNARLPQSIQPALLSRRLCSCPRARKVANGHCRAVY